MKLCSIGFLAILVGLISCSDDDPTNNNDTPLLTISALAGSISDERWVFLTRTDGTLIEAREIPGDGVDVVFERPSGLNDKSFVVHQMYHTENSRSFIIISNTAITGGKLSFNAINPGSALTEVGKHNYSFTNVPFGYSPWITGPKVINYSRGGSNGTFSGTTTLGANNIDLLYWFQVDTNPLVVPKYTLVKNAAAGQTLSMSFADLTPANEQTITFDAKQDFVDVYMGPMSTEEPVMHLYSGLFWSNATEIKLYYPGEAFDAYLTAIETRIGNDRQKYTKTGSIPTNFKSMPASINSFSQASTTFTVTTSGVYDYLNVSGYNRWTVNNLEYSISWSAYMDNSEINTFNIPALPEAIVARYPVLSSAPITPFSFIEITDHNNLNNYSDYVRWTWNTEVFSPSTEYFSRAKFYR